MAGDALNRQIDLVNVTRQEGCYYEISTYSKPAYKKSLEDFAAYALDAARPLAMGESRQGMLFFIVPDGVVQASGLKLIGARLDALESRSTVELQLN